MTAATVVAWVWAHKAELVEDAAGVVAAASLFVKALELLVASLVSLFPQLQEVDGKLQGAAAFLDRLSKWRPLNVLAVNPKRLQAVALPFLLAGMLLASSARAADISSGPTLPLIQVRLGDSPTQKAGTSVLAAGAGYMVSAGFFPRALLGKEFNLLQLSLAGFASGSPAGGQASIAALVCTLNQLGCLGVGVDALTFGQAAPTGLLAGKLTGANLFLLLSVGFEIGIGPAVPGDGLTFDKASWQPLERGNQLRLGL